MKKILSISIILMLFGTISAANAAAYTDSHSISGKGFFLKKNKAFKHEWAFNIATKGYNAAVETITGISIRVRLRDDRDKAKEKARLRSPGSSFKTSKWKVNNGFKTFKLTASDISALTSFSSTGILNMRLVATKGDFFFKNARINVRTKPSAVPAPSALLLMGSGLIAIASATRRKAKKA